MMYLNDDVLYNIFRIMSFVLYHELILTSSSIFNFSFLYFYFEFAMYDIYCPFYPEMYS